ncbi:hypothetical protein [Sunxiuqinia dokdonensis]|uniref:Uncharacterized protein n=1 Tax=Sunxiuqinia dokdonensis TaxID=1409788 RepID=A0A0L8VCC7_9BACT|nr:hypothetical protein [Sunxiuqinia dokdonensis]KOH46104.1 hypothetical protein NC99_10680 [Sunxiuqinia dokdonensis]
MQSIEKQMEDMIVRTKRGSLLLPEDFRPFGSSEAVRLALHRRVKKGNNKECRSGFLCATQN